MKTNIVIQFLLFFSCSCCYAQYGFDTVTVYFPVNKSSLTTSELQKLDSLSAAIRRNDQKILIYGYADYLGNEMPNQELSEARAEVVKSYLLSQGFKGSGILTCMGVGQVKERRKDSEGNQLNRRTDIFVKRLQSRAAVTTAEQKVVTVEKEEAVPDHLLQTITTLDSGAVMVLDNIQFYPSSHQPLKESVPVLKELIATLKQVPTLRIKIEGHICCIKDKDDALDIETGEPNLSTARARFIYQFLIKNGIGRERLSYEGYGRKRPLIAEEQTEADAKANRRVEIRILSK